MVKEKPKCQRSYDLDGYRKRAACVCVKNENENEVLLISSSKNKQYWVIPGGGIEENENPGKSTTTLKEIDFQITRKISIKRMQRSVKCTKRLVCRVASVACSAYSRYLRYFV